MLNRGLILSIGTVSLFIFNGSALAHRNHTHGGVCVRNGKTLVLSAKNEVQQKSLCSRAGGKWFVEEHDHDDDHEHGHKHCFKDGKEIEVEGADEAAMMKNCADRGGKVDEHQHEHSHESGHGHEHTHSDANSDAHSHDHYHCKKDGKELDIDTVEACKAAGGVLEKHDHTHKHDAKHTHKHGK